ncbi:MAG: TIGR00282 family metallophosphoesterase [Patescibacteria group bacterium]|nr:YmdB family metallophosphoesterase [Patescibacteria group bacterium]
MKILFFGDVVGKIGRKALAKVLPDIIKEHEPDFVLGNGENLAHGIGFTEDTVLELLDLGFNFLTSGNHVFDKEPGIEYLKKPDAKILRPANFPSHDPGKGHVLLEVGTKRLLIINLLGQVFIEKDANCPFRELDTILEGYHEDDYDGMLIDFHAEATSEKEAMGFYADGRASAVLGTHTHVGTCDEWILPMGTAYCSDVGMVGARESILGGEKEPILKRFLTKIPLHFEPPESGRVTINAVLIETDPQTKLAVHIKRIDQLVEV